MNSDIIVKFYGTKEYLTENEWNELINFWEIEDEQDQYYKNLERQWQKTLKFDPYIALEPPINMIEDNLKTLRKENTERKLLINQLGYHAFPKLKESQTKIEEKINKITRRLFERRQNGDWQVRLDTNRITEEDIKRAKEVPITNLYDGRLRKRGRTMVGRCPFPGHNDSTPSFTLWTDSNRYRCFGCHSFGDSIDFYILINQVPWHEAVRTLSNKH